MKKKIQNKLGTYLAVTAGVGCASSVANAAVVFYGNASNPNIQAGPSFAFTSYGYTRAVHAPEGARFSSYERRSPAGTQDRVWTQGGDGGPYIGGASFAYYSSGVVGYGAVEGSQNYANVTFDGFDGVYEAVAQFFFVGTGGGYLMAIATTNAIPNPQNLSGVGGPALSISAGKAMIDAAAAIPEPSSLALLALGATGLIARRRRAA